MLKGILRACFLTITFSTLAYQSVYAAPGDIVSSFTINNVSGDGRVPSTPQGITYQGGFLWVVDLGTDRIYRVYPETVFDTDGITVLFNPGDSDFNIPLTDSTGATAPFYCDIEFTNQICGGGGLTFAENFFWNANANSDDIIKLDPVDGDNLESENGLASFTTPAPNGITYDGTHFWIADWQTNTISEVLPEDGSIIRTISGPSSLPVNADNPGVSPFAQPLGLAWDGLALWVVDSGDEVVYRYDPDTETILSQFTIPSGGGTNPHGIAWDGEFLWHTDQGTSTIYKLESGVIPFGIVGCVEKNGVPLSAGALLSQTSNADQSQSLDSDGCFIFSAFESGVGVSLSIDESGSDEKPTLTLAQVNGSVNVSVELGGIYTEPGYTAIDTEDGDISANVVAVPDVINSPFLIDTSNLDATGVTITYDVVDSAGNAADTQTRTVFVVPVAHEISGTLSGLNSGNSIVLTNNGGDALTVSADSTFTFPTQVLDGEAYNVEVSTQPTGQSCSVTNGSGTATADVTNVQVTCSDIIYDITVTTSGLDTGDTIDVANNGIPTTISANGSTIIDSVTFNTNYDVTIVTPPTNKSCQFAATSDPASGNVSAAVNVEIECGFIQFTLGGTLTGLDAGDSPALRVEFDSVLTTLAADGAYTLSNGINSGASYNVALSQTPSNKNCTITNATGIATANVTNIDITCVDNIPPSVPTVNSLTTSDTTPAISGTATVEAGDSLSVSVNGVTYDNVAVSGGNWSVDTGSAIPTTGSFTPLTDGTYEISATLTDQFSNSSSDVSSNELTIDTAAPTVPTVNSLSTNIVPPGPISGTGTLLPGDSLSITINGATYDNIGVSGSVWSVNLSSATPSSGVLGAFVDGVSYDVVATVTDSALNSVTDVSSNEITIDQTAPNTPATPDLVNTSDSGSSNSDNITSDTTPTLTGICATGDTITLLTNGTASGQTQACVANAYSITLDPALADGSFDFTVTATDIAGNTSAASATALTVVIDTALPAAPSVNSLVTNDTTPAISGTASLASGETLSVSLNGFVYQNVTVTANNWSIDTGTDAPATGTFTALGDGSYNIVATTTDTAGNSTNDSTSSELTIDTVAPATPTVNTQTTNDFTPTISGGATLSAGETLNVTVNGASYENVPTNSSVWSIDTGVLPPTSGTLGSFINGNSYSVFATVVDAAGNTATDTTNNEITIDSTPPSTPTVNTLITNALQPTISGTSPFGAGETLSVTINGATYNNVAIASGNWSIDTSSAVVSSGALGTFVDGTSYDVIASVTDSANLTTNDATSNEITIDRTAPALPGIPDLIIQSDSGILDSDNITNDTTPTFSGTCSNGDIITLYVDGSGSASSTACAGSSYSLTTATALTDGAHTISATSTDLASNESAQTTALAITIDTGAPTTPSQPDLTDASDNGASNTDNITSDTTPDFSGTCTTGDTVTLYIDGSASSWNNTCAAGAYLISVGSSLANGTYAFSAASSDVAGNLGTPSTGLNVTIDASAASAPDAPDMVVSSDTGSSNTDNITSDTTPTFEGACTDGETLTFYVDGTATGDTLVCAASAYSVTLSTTFADGSYAITATATGESLVESPQSLATTIIVDTSTPLTLGTPDLDTASDTGSSSTDDITSDSLPTFVGSCSTGDLITLYVDGSATSAIGVCAANAYAITTATSLSEGAHTIAVLATDAAGNQATVSTALSIQVDFTAPTVPAAPDLATLSDTGVSNTDNLTQATTPDFTGACTANDTVNLYIDNALSDTVLCTGSSYSLSSVSALSDGTYQINSEFVDVAGNSSGLSPALAVTVDTVAPTLTASPDLLAASDSGSSNVDNVTNQTFATFTGSCSAGTTVTLFVDNVDSGSSSACSTSTYSITLANALAEGARAISVQPSDDAGNQGSLSSALTVTVDVTAPLSPTPDLASASDTGVSSTDDITFDATPSFTGTCDTGNTIELIVDSVATGTIVSCGAGTYTITTGTLLGDGSHTIAVTETDLAGNIGAPSAPALGIDIDTNAPTTPTAAPDMTAATDTGTSNTDNITSVAAPTFTGPCTTGEQVTLYVDTNTTGASVTCAASAYTLTAPSNLSDGTRSIAVTASDTAGNESALSPTLTITIETGGPTAPNAPDVSAASDSGFSSTDNITNVTQPIVTGVCTNNDIIRLYVDGADSGASDVCAATTYSITTPSVLTEGTHSLAVLAENASGNQSALSAVTNVIIDTTGPTLLAPDLLASSDTGSSNVDNNTQDTTPSFSGICTTGDRVQLLIDAAPNSNPNPAVCSGNSYAVTAASALSDGIRTATVLATDLAGNTGTGSAGLSLTIDTATPVAPTVDTQVATTSTPLISGTATLGINESLSVSVNGATYNNVTVAAGVWNLDLAVTAPSSGTLGAFVDGTSYNVVATTSDLAGNSAADASTNELTSDVEVAITLNVSGFSSAGSLSVTETSTSTNLSVTSNGLTSAINVQNGGTYTFNITAQPSGQVCTFPGSLTSISASSSTDASIAVTCDNVTQTYSASPALTIPANNGNINALIQETSTINVTDDRQIADLNIFVNLTHTYTGDVSLQLTSPSGTSVLFVERPGSAVAFNVLGTGASGDYGCSQDNINATFDDEGGSAAETTCPLTGGGSLTPNNALSAFDGESSLGTWTLTVFDAYGTADGGTLNDWSMEIVIPTP